MSTFTVFLVLTVKAGEAFNAAVQLCLAFVQLGIKLCCCLYARAACLKFSHGMNDGVHI